MLLTAVAWMYVVLMVALVEATSSTGTVMGAVITFVLYGLLPMSIVAYLMLSPARKRARRAADAAAPHASLSAAPDSALDPDQRSHAAGEPVAPVRKEA